MAKLIGRGHFVAYKPMNLINQDKPIIGEVMEVTVDEQLIVFTGHEFIIADPSHCVKINHDFATVVEIEDDTKPPQA